jgi:hypothetical protein
MDATEHRGGREFQRLWLGVAWGTQLTLWHLLGSGRFFLNVDQ